MSQSLIAKRGELTDLFKAYDISEVFADNNFSIVEDYVKIMVVFPKITFNWYEMWEKLLVYFPKGILLHVCRDYDSPVMLNTQLVWKGDWLV